MYITLIIYFALIIVGLCMGSFAAASVWRLRARQLVEDKDSGEEYDMKEYEKLKKLTKKSVVNDRSQCLHCSYELQWYDLIPIFSWVFLKGKCRKCRRPIGFFEPLMELGVAAFFAFSYIFWPYQLTSWTAIASLIIWMISGVMLAVLFAYDKKWYVLPDQLNFALVGVGLLSSILVVISANDKIAALINIGLSIFVLSGIYFVLHAVSKGKWIGFGDVKLGLGLALLLADWQLSVLALFLANLIGCILVIPGLATHKLKKDSRIPFGPLLIIGTVVSLLAGKYIINLYLGCLVF